MKLGLTLPSFRHDPGPVLAVARAADAAGIDGVFAYDHLFRMRGDAPSPADARPALELLTTLGAVAAATTGTVIGALVARVTLRPNASLFAGFDTLHRIAGPGRMVAGIGSGDSASVPENEAFGIADHDRLARLSEAVARGCGRGYPVWVGGNSQAVRHLAAESDGWNMWGGDAAQFRERAADVRREVESSGRDPDAFACTWGGLAVVAGTQSEAERKLERLGGDRPGLVWGGPERVAEAVAAYVAAGAAWVVLGPIDSAQLDNVAVLGEAVRPLLT